MFILSSYTLVIEDVLVRLNPGLPWQTLHLTSTGLFLLAKWNWNWQETSKMRHLVYSFIWC
jgi:hypothetical protein